MYKKISDLPDSVKTNLPRHAKEIYKESFNSALKQYKDPKNRRNPKEDSETIAHQVAWSAVKKEYKKDNDGKWVKKKN